LACHRYVREIVREVRRVGHKAVARIPRDERGLIEIARIERVKPIRIFAVIVVRVVAQTLNGKRQRDSELVGQKYQMAKYAAAETGFRPRMIPECFDDASVVVCPQRHFDFALQAAGGHRSPEHADHAECAIVAPIIRCSRLCQLLPFTSGDPVRSHATIPPRRDRRRREFRRHGLDRAE
jgi:hypothetical protein